MESITVNSLEEYIEYIDKLPPDYTLSRGQEKDFSLLPSAMRCDEDGMKLYSKSLRKSFIEDFKINSAQYVDSSAMTNEYEWLVYAQHFGVPTCLLDFTYSHLVSVMFAVENAFKYEEDDEENSVIWILNPNKLNQMSIKRSEIVNVSYGDNKCLADIEYPCAITAKKSNPRIAAQNGLFVYFNEDKPLEEIEIANDCLKKIIIPHSCGKKILKSLFVMGMRFVDIYPELSSISKDILLKNKIREFYNMEENNE
ncbi:FRG domain-containing protein [Butyrivibrio proteoclasticus]|uniref:FRG domain-containing protein n=1 Tax=Butyrivibrio proteoclasticus TaxID=43305 RepID=A0A1I5VI73_9FIRM|nr:FRG domain-containing protein [Butyrivibrio proteoclasticus]SFQ07179.1 FRG domain-containing protein [Butyrivibrio proteoclasticus]